MAKREATKKTDAARKKSADAKRAARRALERDIDAALDRLEVGIAARLKTMEVLLENFPAPPGRRRPLHGCLEIFG